MRIRSMTMCPLRSGTGGKAQETATFETAAGEGERAPRGRACDGADSVTRAPRRAVGRAHHA
jgi:hypothetical protein